MKSTDVDTLTLILAMQRVINGDAVGDVVAETLTVMTGYDDTRRLFSDRALTRIENRLGHVSTQYAKLVEQTYRIFAEACAQEAIPLTAHFAMPEAA